jgi:hypothetical protein
MMSNLTPSLPGLTQGLTRQSIKHQSRAFGAMDARVKPAHDDRGSVERGKPTWRQGILRASV